ncbi:MAG TPA: VWA domain-containing protein [Planctomycetota bacterium]|jgi:Ca-activated chloride channel family protein
MELAHREALYLLLPLLAVWLSVSLYARSCRRRAAEAFVSSSMWARLLPVQSGARFWAKTALWAMALALMLVALAGPRFGVYYESVKPRGADLYVLLDVSKSMLSEDVPPSRLGRAKADVSTLLNRLKGERVGLIAFAGKAAVKCPLTTDYDFFRHILDETDPRSAPLGGTAIGDAIRKALEVFPAEAERDQAVLLITDGDDQNSYPREAASAAAEKHVTIFAVGLGDADQGSRVPEEKGGAKTFIEYEGKQVWSKLDNTLLKDIALQTGGIYVPAGTKSYDLGELYDHYLKGRRGAEGQEQKRMRLSEQYQIFLAAAILCLLIDLLILPYEPQSKSMLAQLPANGKKRAAKTAATAGALLLLLIPGSAQAADVRAAVKEGLAAYSKDEFDKAKEKFAEAAEKSGKNTAQYAAIVAFDLACTYHRKGDTKNAGDQYLAAATEAGKAQDRALASEAHYNLGLMSAEEARSAAGETPETVTNEKRDEIRKKLLKEAVPAFRTALNLNPQNDKARRNLELVRQWLKHYEDRWRELDRQKRRKESNLAEFLDYLIQTQKMLRYGVKELEPAAPLDIFAEHKRAQEELSEEIPPLKDKIKADLTPPPQSPLSGQPNPPPQPKVDPKQFEQALALLDGWADEAGKKMGGAITKLGAREPSPAAEDQKSAAAELQKIWEAIIPFQPLLGRDLAEQTAIARLLDPNPPKEEKKPEPEKKGDSKTVEQEEPPAKTPEKAKDEEKEKPAGAPVEHFDAERLADLAESQDETLRRTALLKMKAEAELQRMEQQEKDQQAQKDKNPANPPPPTPAPQPQPDPKNPGAAQGPQQIDPEKIKDGFKKAIELAPKAADKMGSAARSLRAKSFAPAFADAEEARKLLDEIAKAQPKNENKDQNKDKDKDKKDQDKKDEKKDQDKKDEDKKDEKKEQQQEKKEMSKDMIEEVLRKVREREKEKRDRDQKMQAKMYGRQPVDKDW